MDLQTLTYLLVGASFALYIVIALLSRARSTGEFYVAGKHVHPVANGMATAADWMSAASFLSMAGLIAFLGYDGAVYLIRSAWPAVSRHHSHGPGSPAVRDRSSTVRLAPPQRPETENNSPPR